MINTTCQKHNTLMEAHHIQQTPGWSAIRITICNQCDSMSGSVRSSSKCSVSKRASIYVLVCTSTRGRKKHTICMIALTICSNALRIAAGIVRCIRTYGVHIGSRSDDRVLLSKCVFVHGVMPCKSNHSSCVLFGQWKHALVSTCWCIASVAGTR